MKLNNLKGVSLEEGMSQHTSAQAEMKKIANHYKKLNGASMSDDVLRDNIGDELEQLEYSPEEVEKMVPQIVAMIKRG